MQAWNFFEAEALEDSSQHEDILDFNAFTCKMDFDKIKNSCDSYV
jgi:hypothetical protein